MKRFFIIIFLLLALAYGDLYGQKKVDLEQYTSSNGILEYNMSGAEMYLIGEKDTVFLTKIAPYRFLIPDSIDKKISIEKNDLYLAIKTYRYWFYGLRINYENYMREPAGFLISCYKAKKSKKTFSAIALIIFSYSIYDIPQMYKNSNSKKKYAPKKWWVK